jgi:hypothetical protein
VGELELVWGEDGRVFASPLLCFLKNLAQRVARLLCCLAARQNADVIYVICGHGIWRMIAFIYQISIVEEVEDKRSWRALGYACVYLVGRRPEAVDRDARVSVTEEACDPLYCLLVYSSLSQIMKQACVRDGIDAWASAHKWRRYRLFSRDSGVNCCRANVSETDIERDAGSGEVESRSKDGVSRTPRQVAIARCKA